MTIIAYKAGILASDSCISDGTVNVGAMRKIARTRLGILAGACGSADSVEIFLSWAKRGLKPRGKPVDFGDADFTGIAVYPAGRVIFYEQALVPFELNDEFFALGTGADLAIGAMEAKADAVQAVRIAIKRSHGCRGPIQALRLDGEPYEFGRKGNFA